MRTTLLIPTLNEIEGMRAIMPRIDPAWCDQTIVLDGGSTDGTIEYARERGLTVVAQTRPGLRHAYGEVLPHVTGDVLLTFSPDGNSVPELIPPLIEKMSEGYDMVIVSRYLDGAKSDDDDLVTGFGNWMFTTLINLTFGGHYTDAMVIYRAYRTALIRELRLDRDDGYAYAEKIFGTLVSWEPLLSIRCAKCKRNYTEIPGDEPPRIGGVRKLQVVRWGAVFLAQIIRERFRD